MPLLLLMPLLQTFPSDLSDTHDAFRIHPPPIRPSAIRPSAADDRCAVGGGGAQTKRPVGICRWERAPLAELHAGAEAAAAGSSCGSEDGKGACVVRGAVLFGDINSPE